MKFQPQFDSSDCGAACLVMMAAHFGSQWSLTTVRRFAGTGASGTNLLGLIEAADKMGLEAKALKGERTRVPENLPLPCIAHFHKDLEVYHFLIIERVSKSAIHTVDPSEGRRKYSLEGFLSQWTGVVVVVSPAPHFQLHKEERSLFQFLPLFKPHGKLIAQVLLSSVVLVVLGVVGSFYFSYLFDEIIPAKMADTLHIFSLGFLGLLFFELGLGSLRTTIIDTFSVKVSMTLTLSYLKHIFALPLSFFEGRKVGEILSRFQDGEKVRGVLSSLIISGVLDCFLVLIVGVVLFLMDGQLFLLSFLSLPLTSLILLSFVKFFKKNYQEVAVKDSETQSYLVESLNGISTIKGLNATERVFFELEKKIVELSSLDYRGNLFSSLQDLLLSLVKNWSHVLLFWFGSSLIVQDQISIGTLFSFSALLVYFHGPLQRLAGLYSSLQESLVASNRMGEIFLLDEENRPQKGHPVDPLEGGDLVFSRVSFKYGSKALVLRDLNLVFKKGSRTAVIGPSGSGKSTLTKLLLKLYKPTSGNISWGDYDFEDLDTDKLRGQIGYVSQEVFLFSGTVKDNISLHNSEASLQEVMASAKLADAHDFISHLPQRYDHVLSERGASLSGGERQKIALARALLGPTQILVFDEATNHLDAFSEGAFMAILDRLKEKGSTIVFITHKVSSVTHFENIVFLNKGLVCGSGTHSQLLEACPEYAGLF